MAEKPYPFFDFGAFPQFGQNVSGAISPRVGAGYLPQGTLEQLGNVTGKLANYQPGKVDIRKPATLPTEYYQRQIEQLTQPGIKQFMERVRPQAIGDIAYQGNLGDYEGKEKLFDLDRSE